jgi:uncharacterized protein
MAIIGLLTLNIYLPGCNSLKEKRSRLKPLLARLHKEFNISAAEVDHHDIWQSSQIACVLVSNDLAHNQRVLRKIAHWIEDSWHDVNLVNEKIEIL